MTRQVREGDAEYSGQVKQQDADWMQNVRIESTATDAEIQRRLQQLYSTEDTRGKQGKTTQLTTVLHQAEKYAVLAIGESIVQIDTEIKNRMMQLLQNEEMYADILQQLQDPTQGNEFRKNDEVYRMKRGTLMIQEENQASDYSYWRTKVPDNQEVKIELLREIHCVPYVGHPSFTRALEVTRRFFYWVHMTQEVRQFVLDCPLCQVEKGSHLKPAGKLMPLEVPVRKWDHVVIDFVVGLPVQGNCDTICTVVDKATKMCHFIPSTEKISAKQVARLYWQFVGRLHGIPRVLISDRDVRFTSKFYKELWRLLGTNLRMGSGFHPESSGQVEIFNKLLEQTLHCTIHQLGETRNWLEVLPSIEFAVNNTPNRTTRYSAFYLNYGFHPLHPLQLLHAPDETRNEAVVQFTSRMQRNFQAVGQQLNQARQQMMQQTDSSRKSLEFQDGDLVLLSTKHIRFRQCPTKLQRRFVGPFEIIQKVSSAAYRLRLPENWSMHPVFHISLLKSWHET